MNTEDYAIVIGIDEYPEMPARFRLEEAEAGAREFCDWLLDPRGGAVPEEHVVRLFLSERGVPQPEEPYPGKHHLDRRLARLYPGGTGRVGRRLYLYFGGHGLGPSFDEAALLMADAALDRLSNVGVKLYAEHLMHAAPFDELVLFLDCCREIWEQVFLGPPMYTRILDADRASQVCLYQAFATRFAKKAFEAPVPGTRSGGLFTKALLEGLRGRAANQHGAVTGASLKDYLDRRVPELARAAKREQAPDIRPILSEGIVFCTVESLPRLAVHIAPPAGWTGELVLRDGSLTHVVGRRPLEAGDWEIDLQRGIYRLEHLQAGEDAPAHKKVFEVDGGKEPIDVSF